MKLTSWLFRAARISADVNALSRGPEAIAKRIVRKAAGRGFGRLQNWLIPGSRRK
jgi:hypothetical protein